MLKLKRRQKKKIERIAHFNGRGIINHKLNEELKELLDALKSEDETHILEELADVYIMVQQYIHVYGVEQDVSKLIDYKMDRTKKRLEHYKQTKEKILKGGE